MPLTAYAVVVSSACLVLTLPVVGCDQFHTISPPHPRFHSGGDKATGHMQRTQSASSETWMYKPPKYLHSQSVEERGGGKTVKIPSDQLTTLGDHAEVGIGGGGGGGTIELGSGVVTGFDSTRKPEVEASKSEGACVVPNRSEGSGVSESPSGTERADDVDGPSVSERADMVERLDRSEVTNATESRREPEGTDTFERTSKPENPNVVKESKKLEDAGAVSGPNYESVSRVNPSHLNSKPATFRMRTEAGTDSVSPPEDDAPFEGDGGPYHQHRLVGSDTVRHRREATASGGGDGSSPRGEGERRAVCMQCLFVVSSSPQNIARGPSPDENSCKSLDSTMLYMGWGQWACIID